LHQVGDQPRLYYDARSTNHQHKNKFLQEIWQRALTVVMVLHNTRMLTITKSLAPVDQCYDHLRSVEDTKIRTRVTIALWVCTINLISSYAICAWGTLGERDLVLQ
jgi:hypothetical protein